MEIESFPGLHESFSCQLDEKSFSRLSSFIHSRAGIKLPPTKRIMLQSRLQRRLRALDMKSFATYTDFVLSEPGKGELVHMLDAVSTNKTDFFREEVHFHYLTQNVLPQYYGSGAKRQGMSNGGIRVWSAGCSSGQEPYTIAIVIEEFLASIGSLHSSYSILGTDLSTRVLHMARTAVYKEEVVKGLDFELKRKYFLKSRDRTNPTVRVVPKLRSKVRFERLNFMDNSYHVEGSFDVVFCRNVLIYFDRPTQERVLQKLCEKLRPGGYFFLGHSESIMNMDLPLQVMQPTIFKKV